jgi:pilus assembly protein CpaB
VDPITGVAGNIAPGSHVDILGTFPQGGPSGARPGVSGVAALHTIPVLSNVTIIALDSRVREDDYTVAQSGQRTRNYSSVTVGVTPDEAALLIYAQQFGQLTLALRPPADATPPTTLDVSDKNLLDLVGQAEKKREERMKNKSAIEVVPANP